MSRLAIAQIFWPPIPSMALLLMLDWLKEIGSMAVTGAVVMAYIYIVFAPALVAIFWKQGEKE